MNNFYTVKAADWRKQLRANDFRTRFVIALFLLIYLAVGLVIDLYIRHEYVQPISEIMPLSKVLFDLITFRIIPYATIITFSIAVISIFISYALYDRIVMLGTNYKEVLPENSISLEERQLYNVVEELKVAAGLRFMPKVFIIFAPYMNAFASGYSEKSALVAITDGLMKKLNRSELQAVLAHELTHIRHHDIKVTMAASIMCNILLIAIDILFRGMIYGSLGGRGRRDNRSNGSGSILFLVIILLRFILPVLTLILLLFLSRTREYMADAGAVELMRDNTPLANALLKIENDHKNNLDAYSEIYRKTPHEEIRRSAYIFEPTKAGIKFTKSLTTLFSTHPPVVDRLKALGFMRKE